MPGIVLMGLGGGAPEFFTREALEILLAASEVWLPSRQQSAVAGLPGSITVYSITDALETGSSTEIADAAIVRKVIELGRRPQGVIYAILGSILAADSVSAELLRRAAEEGLPVRIVPGTPVLPRFPADPGSAAPGQLTLCDAGTVGKARVPSFPPDIPTVISGMSSRAAITDVQTLLKTTYPADHPVTLIHEPSLPSQQTETRSLDRLNSCERYTDSTILYVPPLEKGTSIESLQDVVARLRAPDGCPWDRQQTHASLRRHLLEEAYEAIAAMDLGDVAGMREELGDLLLQIVLNCQIGAESGEFMLNDVAKGIHDKIIRRHPHVFAELKLDGVESVLANWERLKETERDTKEDPGGLLEGVPLALPALSQAQEYQERAARVGFDWPAIKGVLDKVEEEIKEMEGAGDVSQLASEIGDVLFALVNLSRWKGVDAESALRAANARFKSRFGVIEEGARQRQRRLSELSLDEMEALWQQAKRSVS